jgi:hypothetical protein
LRNVLPWAAQLVGIVLVLVGAFLTSIPLGIAVCGLALLALGWALDRS